MYTTNIYQLNCLSNTHLFVYCIKISHYMNKIIFFLFVMLIFSDFYFKIINFPIKQ